MRILPYKGEDTFEKRPAFFLKSFGKKVEVMHIISFGTCNFQCPYCKRGGQFINSHGSLYSSTEYSKEKVYEEIDYAIARNQRVRLSGGDPCMHIKESLSIANYCNSKGVKISMAHNGSSLSFTKLMMPYLEYAAIDLKASNSVEMNLRTGINNGYGSKMLSSNLRIQEVLSNAGVLVDIRTCVFSSTTLDDMMKIADMICKSGDVDKKFWTIRAYKEVHGISWRPMQRDTTIECVDQVASKYSDLRIGFRDEWIPKGFLYWNER